MSPEHRTTIGERPQAVKATIPPVPSPRISVVVAIDGTPAEGLASRLPRARVRHYHHGALAAYFVAQLRETLNVEIEPLAVRRRERDAQARRLLPAGLAAPCGVRADPVPLTSTTLTRTPRLTSEVSPHSPPDALADRPRGTVILRAVVGEDGTVASTADAGGTDDPRLRAEAHAATALWRFMPGFIGTCPVAVRVTIELTFTP
jgi:TonB family protein